VATVRSEMAAVFVCECLSALLPRAVDTTGPGHNQHNTGVNPRPINSTTHERHRWRVQPGSCSCGGRACDTRRSDALWRALPTAPHKPPHAHGVPTRFQELPPPPPSPIAAHCHWQPLQPMRASIGTVAAQNQHRRAPLCVSAVQPQRAPQKCHPPNGFDHSSRHTPPTIPAGVAPCSQRMWAPAWRVLLSRRVKRVRARGACTSTSCAMIKTRPKIMAPADRGAARHLPGPAAAPRRHPAWAWRLAPSVADACPGGGGCGGEPARTRGWVPAGVFAAAGPLRST